MIEIYILAGLAVFILGIIGYNKILRLKAEKLETEKAELVSKVAVAEHEVAQKVKTETAVAKVEEKLQGDYQAQKTRIEKGAPRDQFDTTEF